MSDDTQKGRIHLVPSAVRGDGGGLLSKPEEQNFTQQAAAAGDSGNDGAFASHGFKTETSARREVMWPARRAGALVERGRRAQRMRRDWHEARAQQINSERTRAGLVQVAEHDVRTVRMGALALFVAGWVVWALLLGVLFNDPMTVYASVREGFDVPGAVKLYHFGHPDHYKLLIAVGWALVMTLLVFGGVKLLAGPLGTLLFRPQLANQKDRFPAAEDSHSKHPGWHLAIMSGVGAMLLIATAFMLHAYAKARFLADFVADDGPVYAVATTLVWAITLLPAIIAALETFTHSPQQAHIAKVARLARRHRRAEKRDIRVEQRLLEGERRAIRRAHLAVLSVVDNLAAVVLRADFQAAEAAQHGLADVAPIAELFRTVAEGTREEREIDYSGRPPSLFLPGLRVVTAKVADTIDRYFDLEQIPEDSPIAELWRQRRDEASQIADTATYLPPVPPPAVPDEDDPTYLTPEAV
ncbi:MAG TPA: hypothetical protein PKE40_01105 [Arachnia sp.]|nr:hypothetical protein [Arachnia sp.]HMT84925.1 hypothetical protein [Arachnia sp.]